jgi:hypothetical protein
MISRLKKRKKIDGWIVGKIDEKIFKTVVNWYLDNLCISTIQQFKYNKLAILGNYDTNDYDNNFCLLR